MLSEIHSPDQAVQSLVAQALAGKSDTVQTSVTLPPAAYTSQAFFDLEMDRIFRREWLCVGHVSQVPNTGDYFTIDLVGEPLVVVRGADRIRVMSSVCLHRWAPVVTGSGSASVFSCPFHKWTYALDGRLMGAPHMEQAEGFVARDCRLPEIRTEIIEALGLIFVTLDKDAAPLTPQLTTMIERVTTTGWDQNLVILDSSERVNNYNWKILVETYMECYHHIGAHSRSLQPWKPGSLSRCEENHGSWSICHSIAKPDLADEDKGKWHDNQLVLAYPMLLMGVRPGACSLQILMPEGPGKTRVRRYSLGKAEDLADPEKIEAGRKRLARIIEEDDAVNDMQQIGARSTLAVVGRLSHLEGSVWHLAEYVRGRLAD
jgi:phenylpropionate dioxygenase-like ring-hydroxylating dioxygenase large terminal subunit